MPDVLAEGRERLSPLPPRPPGRCPLAELAAARLAIANQAQARFAATAPPRLAGGWALLLRAGRAWWIERDVSGSGPLNSGPPGWPPLHERLEAGAGSRTGRAAALAA